MAEWKEYTGSDEQIAEMYNAPHGWIVEYIDTVEPFCTAISQVCFSAPEDTDVIQKYLICNPHPKADMIYQQARTGQPVWVRVDFYQKDWELVYIDEDGEMYTYVTTTPDWNIRDAEYSFNPFEVR